MDSGFSTKTMMSLFHKFCGIQFSTEFVENVYSIYNGIMFVENCFPLWYCRWLDGKWIFHINSMSRWIHSKIHWHMGQQVVILSLLQNSWLVPPSPSFKLSSCQDFSKSVQIGEFYFDVMCSSNSNRPFLAFWPLLKEEGKSSKRTQLTRKAEKGSVLWHSLFQ